MLVSPLPGLPLAFLDRLSSLMGAEFGAFLASYAQAPRAGLRLNTLISNLPASHSLWSRDRLDGRPGKFEILNWIPVPWCASGYLLPPGTETNLAHHPYHAAGAYYLQEPSAMAPAEALAPQPGEAVLDLCAAPGGKSTHIAALMRNGGLLVANDPHARRARALAMNLERCGVTCALVLNETPERLAARWPGGFDRVLVDAPCSGQGMFRKSKPARAEWQPGRIKTDAARQSAILDSAAQLVRPGGSIVYSTCTFEPEENEGNIARFLRRHPSFELETIAHKPGFSPGRPEWADGNPALSNCVRVWPHLSLGEGHFIARLHRQDSEGAQDEIASSHQFIPRRVGSPEPPSSVFTTAANLFHEFCDEYLANPLPGQLLQAGQDLYLAPPGAPALYGLRVVRWGWWVGTIKGQVFAPGHALAMALTPAAVRQSLDLAADDPHVAAYLRGESLQADGGPGWVLVMVDGLPLGWGKRTGDRVKNRRPPGLAQATRIVSGLEE